MRLWALSTSLDTIAIVSWDSLMSKVVNELQLMWNDIREYIPRLQEMHDLLPTSTRDVRNIRHTIRNAILGHEVMEQRIVIIATHKFIHDFGIHYDYDDFRQEMIRGVMLDACYGALPIVPDIPTPRVNIPVVIEDTAEEYPEEPEDSPDPDDDVFEGLGVVRRANHE